MAEKTGPGHRYTIYSKSSMMEGLSAMTSSTLKDTSQDQKGHNQLPAKLGKLEIIRGPHGIKKSGIYPEPLLPEQLGKTCTCNQNYLKENFCLSKHPLLEFHKAFFSCSVCHRRPADKLCCRTWNCFCNEHAQEYYEKNKSNHIFCNYEIWQYEECYWCYVCNAFCACEAFDPVLEILFSTKGSFMDEIVTDKHTEYYQDDEIKVGAGTIQGWRSDNEDAHVVQLGLPKSGLDFFAVYDGHGGPLVARYASNKTHILFDETCAKCKDPMIALIKAFTQTDECLGKDTSQCESGSTGCTANVVVLDRKKQKLYCANAGDCRAVMYANSKVVVLSQDHRPTLPSERTRIIAAGGTVSEDDRVEGLLAVSRAFGDFDFKQASAQPVNKQAVTSFPDVNMFNLTGQEMFVVVGCDGVWDSLTNQSVVDLVVKEMESTSDPEKIVMKILDRCIAKEIPEDGTGTDNVSCILIMLK